jgi:hypothetical protein
MDVTVLDYDWLELTTDSGKTVLLKSEVCAVTLDTENGAGTTYSIHMKSGTIFTTRNRPLGLKTPTMKTPVMK